jgi:hypothetical protein
MILMEGNRGFVIFISLVAVGYVMTANDVNAQLVKNGGFSGKAVSKYLTVQPGGSATWNLINDGEVTAHDAAKERLVLTEVCCGAPAPAILETPGLTFIGKGDVECRQFNPGIVNPDGFTVTCADTGRPSGGQCLIVGVVTSLR